MGQFKRSNIYFNIDSFIGTYDCEQTESNQEGVLDPKIFNLL
jgi:hypothetical protein